jgi:hypothetical protein
LVLENQSLPLERILEVKINSMSILPLTVPPKKLAQSIASSATSFKLNNIKGWGGVDLAPSDFGTEAYGVFINSTRTQIELFKFDPATIADASIDILARGLGYSGGDAEVPANKFAWASNDTTVQLGTDAPQLFTDFLSSSNPVTVTAKHTYTELPESAVAPVDNDDLVNKAYVDQKTGSALAVPVAQGAHGFVVGDVLKATGANTYAKAQANSAANAEVVGIVNEVVDAGNFTYTTEGVMTVGVPAVAAGTVLFLDPSTAGALTATEPSTIGQVSVPLAVVTENATSMVFHKYRGALLNTLAGVPIASETVGGVVEVTTLAQLHAGTATGETGAPLVVTADKLVDSTIFGRKGTSIPVIAAATDVTTGDGKMHIVIPEMLNGMNLVRAQAVVITAGTTGATTVMVHNLTDTQDMLSGAISIASGATVGTVGTINTTYDDVATNDVLRIDVDSVSTTAPKGLIVVLEFALP